MSRTSPLRGEAASATRSPDLVRILALVEDRLEQVEARFRESLASPVSIVDEIGTFVGEGGGKRIRPTLHLLATDACGYRGPHDVLLGTVVEFIHCATLIHDDIIDDSRVRRGRPSVNHTWGNDVGVLFGDYMFAKAMSLALEANRLPVMEKLADVTLRMTEGEMLQTRYVGRLDLTLEDYLGLVEKKTAALFACCCELAGILADAAPEKVSALRRYGFHLGMLFQIVDDLLDFTSDPQTLGKPTASDLREGKATLAVLDLLAEGEGGSRALVEAAMAADSPDADAVLRLTEALEQRGCLTRVRDRGRFHAARAGAELAALPRSAARDALGALPTLLLERER